MFSSEIYEILKNSYFDEHLWTTSSWLSEPVRESSNENGQVFESKIIKFYAIL